MEKAFQELTRAAAKAETDDSLVTNIVDRICGLRASEADYEAATVKCLEDAKTLGEVSTTEPNPTVMAHFDALNVAIQQTIGTLNAIQVFIAARAPELKDEDNTGVEVQRYVLGQVNDFRGLLEGVGEKKSSRFQHTHAKLDYLSARADLETKLNPTGKDAAAPASGSLKLQLKELDRSTLVDLGRSWQTLKRTIAAIAFLVARNQKFLLTPRRAGHSMIS